MPAVARECLETVASMLLLGSSIGLSPVTLIACSVCSMFPCSFEKCSTTPVSATALAKVDANIVGRSNISRNPTAYLRSTLWRKDRRVSSRLSLGSRPASLLKKAMAFQRQGA
tara:strand:+ start:2653 stop:2991 length:339 start_codon:yes stop_codon:yes gene_type:complete